ncbi:MAG TPA: tetratricopeptide repeat protein [Candidatus Binataceae bacterium]|jgi:regulator of sirC expression with transglutaminase-like and TPR domain|nr:tetratricopeptide repeat protein [Candidatus Binataceae bacterium]
MSDTRDEFARLAARDPIPLARGALLIAKEEYPGLDIDQYLGRIDQLAREAAAVVGGATDTVTRIQGLSDFLFTQKGFDGNRDQFGDPRNSFLNEVLERKLGIPITLSVLYIEVGRQLGLNLFGVSFPAHFLVKAVDERGEIVIDPFNGGAILSLDEIRARVAQIYGQPVDLNPAMLKAAGARDILSRMLRNLKNLYAAASDWHRALSAVDRILLLDPRALGEVLERGALYERLECFSAALDEYRRFLQLAPDHAGAEAAREGVVRLMRQVARLN